MHLKKCVLKILQNQQENICTGVSILTKLQAEDLQPHLKETLAQVFSCVFYKIFKNIFFYKRHQGDCLCPSQNLSN